MQRLLFLFSICMAFGSITQAQMRYALDSASILIGDQTTLTISHTEIYPGADQLTNNGIVAVGQWFDTVETSGKQEIVQRTVLTSFDTGSHWLHITEQDSVLLMVRDVPNVDTTAAIMDIADIMNEPYTFWEIFRWILLGIGIVVLVVAAIYVLRRIRNKQPIIQLPKAPPLPPHIQALNALESLRLRQLWQQGKVKEYHTELTDILRQYLADEFQIQSSEMTTDQTLDAIADAHVGDSNTTALLQRILQTADMVKFAKSEPLPYEHDKSMSDAVEWVNLLSKDRNTSVDNEV